MISSDQNPLIRIAHAPGRVQVLFNGHAIADSGDVLVLYENGRTPVRYFPRHDVQMEVMRRTDKVTHCPAKGDAVHFTFMRDGVIAENGAWSYEDPHAAVSEIADRLAFYPENVDFQDQGLTASDTARRDIDEAVRHTDSGAGSSQAQPWPPTVERPDEAALDAPGRPYEGTGSI